MKPKTPAETDDAIDAWHALPSPPPCPLHEWLGMTWEEYARWAARSGVARREPA